jgi:hypothetical protein
VPLLLEPLLLELWCFLWLFLLFLAFFFVSVMSLPEAWLLACEPDWPEVEPDCALALNDIAIAAATEAPSIAFNSLCIFMSIS